MLFQFLISHTFSCPLFPWSRLRKCSTTQHRLCLAFCFWRANLYLYHIFFCPHFSFCVQPKSKQACVVGVCLRSSPPKSFMSRRPSTSHFSPSPRDIPDLASSRTLSRFQLRPCMIAVHHIDHVSINKTLPSGSYCKDQECSSTRRSLVEEEIQWLS
jgi:hypothetical protein